MDKKTCILAFFLIAFSLCYSQTKFETKEIHVSPPYKIEVYTMPFCGHCKVVESRLKKNDISYDAINIFLSKKSHKEMIEKSLGEDGTPRIFINDYYIGGRRDFDKINETILKKIALNEPVKINAKASKDI